MTRIAFLLFPGLTQLDLTGPAQILSRLPDSRMDLVWETRDPVMSDAGFAIVPTATFEDVTAVDILCIPGGIGVADVMNHEAAMAWIGNVARDAAWITSVCTGSLILGAAGLLRGFRATTHWAWHHHLSVFGAEPVKAHTVVDRNRVTGGGVTAGIDFALTLTALLHGEAVARVLQVGFEYDPAPPFDAGSPDKAGQEAVDTYLARAQRIAPDRERQLLEAAARLGFS
jgi:cyclohexyl-isocyanide hydratase